jgi:hypothetical protein
MIRSGVGEDSRASRPRTWRRCRESVGGWCDNWSCTQWCTGAPDTNWRSRVLGAANMPPGGAISQSSLPVAFLIGSCFIFSNLPFHFTCMWTVLLPLAVGFRERLAQRVVDGPQVHGADAAPMAPRATAREVIIELSRFIAEAVEPALSLLREHEQQRGSVETCFATAGGEHLRFQCCVYYSTLTAAMLEQHYGDGTASAPRDGLPGTAMSDRGTMYRFRQQHRQALHAHAQHLSHDPPRTFLAGFWLGGSCSCLWVLRQLLPSVQQH